MHGIAASQARNQRACRKKHVAFNRSVTEVTVKPDPSTRGNKVTMSTKALLRVPDENAVPRRRKNSSPRSGLMPADTLIPPARSSSSSSSPINRNEITSAPSINRSHSWNPTSNPIPRNLQVPSVAINLADFTRSLNDIDSAPAHHSASSVIELATEEDIFGPSNRNKRQSVAGNQTRNSLTPTTANAVRRHASLAVDNPSRQVRQNILKRGSVAMDQIKRIDLDQEYSVYKQLGSGRFGLIKLAEHKQYKKNIAIKFFPRPQVKQNDFVREYNYSFFLSPHPNIIDTYDGMYQTNDDSAFFFVQEFSPHASLREAVEASTGGIGEESTKLVFSKVLSAIEFMHDENLVHRNLKAENILLFDKEYNRVKITDFGLTRKVDTTVKYVENVTPYHAPELCETIQNEVVTLRCSIDVWSLGILFYYCLKGKFPWQKATILNKSYWEWEQYTKRKIPNLPKRWDPFSEKSLKIFKKSLNTKYKDRWTAKDMRKCVERSTYLKITKQESAEQYVYYPEETITTREKEPEPSDGRPRKKKSIIHQWINNTLTTMAEISEQVVSARND